MTRPLRLISHLRPHPTAGGRKRKAATITGFFLYRREAKVSQCTYSSYKNSITARSAHQKRRNTFHVVHRMDTQNSNSSLAAHETETPSRFYETFKLSPILGGRDGGEMNWDWSLA